MRTFKKIGAAMLAAVMLVATLAVTAFAVDPIGTSTIILKDGVQVTEQIPYADIKDYNYGHNYKDFKFTVPSDGKLVLTIDAAINNSDVAVYNAGNFQEVNVENRFVSVGGFDDYCSKYFWDSSAGIMSCQLTYKVTKGDYIIRVRRYFNQNYRNMGKSGNGRIYITAEMQKPEAPAVNVSATSSDSLTFTWIEPQDATAYDITYKASGESKWKTVSDINDHTYTIKNLKSNTKYTYKIRTKAGGIVGNWSKAASVTTAGAAKLTAPSVSGTKLSMKVTWKAVKGATSYKVGYSLDKKKWTYVTTTSTSATFPVVSGKTYYYRVQAKNNATTGPWSAVKSVTVK